MEAKEVAETAAALRRLLAAIAAGELEATPQERDRLEGAALALEAISGSGASDRGDDPVA